ncbi:hypothetical protein DFP73DRAFT_583419 [Morchella snyderi]|nr:hypothetical protein DFP73DRAFT_583419 [Morchella snyderi]
MALNPFSRYQPRPTTNWRPFPLRLAFLLPFTLICILLITLLELTLRACLPHGCPTFGGAESDPSTASADAAGDSAATLFVYNYLPTIITVLFGSLCAIVHHDAMRMEPWFQMSKPQGARPEESLLLAYSYMMPPYVPIAALKNRHYTVFTASLLVLISTLVLTPLTAGLFDNTFLTLAASDSTTHRLLRWSFNYPSEFDKYNDTIGSYSSRHEYLAYNHGWLNGSLPPFTTAEYALSPWAAAESVLDGTQEEGAWPAGRGVEMWTGETVLYEADLVCEEAIPNPFYVDGYGLFGYNLSSATTPYLSYPVWDVGLFNISSLDYPPELVNLSETGQIPVFDTWSYYKERERFQTGADWYALADLPTLRTPLTEEQTDVLKATAVFMWAQAPPPISPGYNISVVAELGKRLLPPRWSAIFCEPAYYSQPVTATVSMPSGAVENITRHGDRTVIPSANSSSVVGDLLRNLNNGLIRSEQQDPRYYDANGNLVGLGQLPQKPADSGSHLVRRFGGTEETMRVQAKSENLVQNGFPAFALHSVAGNDTLESLLDWQVLARVYGDALKLTFAMLCTDEWVLGRTEANATVVVERSWKVRGFAASVGWARGLQGVLAALAVMAAGLGLVGTRRRCELDGEPGSLGASLGVLERSEGVRELLVGVEFHRMSTVARMLRVAGMRYRLVLEEGMGPRVEVMKGGEGGVGEGVLVKLEEMEADEEKHREKAVWPVSTGSAIFFISFFAVMLGLVVVLWVFVGVDRGIPAPAPQSSIGYKFLFSYAPTLFGLSIEPLLVSLGSHLCMLAPYSRLLRGPTRASRSLSLDLDKSPPHFQLLRALRAKHWLVAALSAAILLSNVLAVALSALFTPNTGELVKSVTVDAPVSAAVTGGFEGKAMMEGHYTLYAALSASITVPNWTTEASYILPFALPDADANADPLAAVTARTISLSATVSCAPVERALIRALCAPTGIGPVHLNQSAPCMTKPIAGGNEAYIAIDDPCWPLEIDSSKSLAGARFIPPAGDALAWTAACPRTFFAAWAQQTADPLRPGNYSANVDVVALKCQAAEAASHVTVTVDHVGNVLTVADEQPLSVAEMTALYGAAGAGGGGDGDGAGGLMASYLNATYSAAMVGLISARALSWFNSHLALLYPAVMHPPAGEPLSHLPREGIERALEDVFRRLYVLTLRLSGDEILAVAAARVGGTVSRRRGMVDVGVGVLGVVGGLLLGIAAVVAAVYWCGAGKGEGVAHAPRSLVGVWAGVYGNLEAQQVVGAVRGASAAVRVRRVEGLGRRWGYGSLAEGVGGKGREGVFPYPEGQRKQRTDTAMTEGVTRAGTVHWLNWKGKGK